ncbi:MAG: zf-HC2 domain-containing protein [Planctomycetota bacterium]
MDRDNINSDCEYFGLLISAKMDAEISMEEDVLLRKHLAACPACQARSENFETLNELLIWGETDSSPVARLCDSTDPPVHWFNGFPREIPMGLAALFCIVITIGMWSGLATRAPLATAITTDELLRPLVLLQEINRQRTEDQESLRESLEMDLRTLKLQLVSLERIEAEQVRGRIDELMKKVGNVKSSEQNFN